MEPLEIGLSTAALYPHHLTEDALEVIAALDFPVVEIFLQADEEYTLPFGAELARRCRALGLRVHSLHLHVAYFDLWQRYPRHRRETHDRFLRVLEIASRLGAQALTWHGLRYGIEKGPLVEEFFDSARWAGEQAQAAGVTLCLENVSWCYLRTPAQVAVVRREGLPVGFTFDSFQAGESGTDPLALVRAMDGDLTTVHLADYAPDGPRHLPPGKGGLDWPAILRTLLEVGYTGPLIIEPAHVEDEETFRQARAFIRQVLADISPSSTASTTAHSAGTGVTVVVGDGVGVGSGSE